MIEQTPTRNANFVDAEHDVNYPDDIAELEAELERVLSMVERDEAAMARSQRPQIERVFLSSARKLRQNLEERLRSAKA